MGVPGGNATENRTHGCCYSADRASCSRRASSGHSHSPSESSTTRCTRRCRRYTTYRTDKRGGPGPRGTLFLEATQLKTVRTATVVLRVDSAAVEVQAAGIVPRRERRPAEPVVADAKQCTVALGASGVAEARGRAASLFLEATQRKTVRTVIEALWADTAVVEVQAAGIASRRERRPDVPVVTDVI